jgi:hypothetical protein
MGMLMGMLMGHADGMPIVRLNWECGLSVKEVYLARVYRT